MVDGVPLWFIRYLDNNNVNTSVIYVTLDILCKRIFFLVEKLAKNLAWVLLGLIKSNFGPKSISSLGHF